MGGIYMRRNYAVNVRFSEEEYDMIKQFQEQVHCKKAATLLRNLSLNIASHPQLKFVYDMSPKQRLDLQQINRQTALLEQAALILKELHKEGLISEFIPEIESGENDNE